MIIGIDATNIRSGGGLTHLNEVLSHATPAESGVVKVVVWSSTGTLSVLPDRPWLHKRTHPLLNKSFVYSFFFQIFFISALARKEGVDLMFIPGGTFLGNFKDIVSMSQNMLPFETSERNRFPRWTTRFKFILLEYTQSYTFKRSKGVVFLTEYARTVIDKAIKLKNKKRIISHGINLNFIQAPRQQKDLTEYSLANPYRFLYVSIVTAYKHQWNVAEAVLRLRSEGFPVNLQLVGGCTSESADTLESVIGRDPFGCIEYEGMVPYEKLEAIYKQADGFVFASSCENQPIILIEAMSAGLPIACSDRGPMPELLKDAGVYFNPLDIDSIYKTLKELLQNKEMRYIKAQMAFNTSTHYTWKECADQTFNFLSEFKK